MCSLKSWITVHCTCKADYHLALQLEIEFKHKVIVFVLHATHIGGSGLLTKNKGLFLVNADSEPDVGVYWRGIWQWIQWESVNERLASLLLSHS